MTLVPTTQSDIETPIPDWTAAFLMEYGPNTRSAYASDLKKWFEFCRGVAVTPQNATRGACAAFCRAQTEISTYSPSTVSRRLAAISAWYRYALVEGIIDRNPMDAVRRPKVSKETTSTGLIKDQLDGLIEAARIDGIESYALILLLAMNGLRISEALGIAAWDLADERGHMTAKVSRKGGKISTIPLNKVTEAAVLALAREKGNGKLFDMDRFGAWRLVKRLGGDHPHQLRHTFCTQALEAGASLYDVQQACDHADPRTTERYLHAVKNLDHHPTFLLENK
jgi:site-specific recombinase XerD